MVTRLSAGVVSALMMGGWMMGTSAMYEYAATATGPRRCGASFEVRKIAVGPSAPPMMPIDAASGKEKPSLIAPRNVANMPICAAAPRSMLKGLAMSGPEVRKRPDP